MKAVREGLEDYKTATELLESARRASAIAGTALDRVIEQWNRQLEKTHGALVAEFGRARAEAFFPKVRAARVKAGGSNEGGGNGGEGNGGSNLPAR